MDKLQRIPGSVWHNHWAHKGHVFGQCIVNNAQTRILVNIPKNASVSITDLLVNNLDWHHSNFHTMPGLETKKSLIFLRDPIDRWLSGICEYFYRNYEQLGYSSLADVAETISPAMVELIFNRVAFDEHTEKQVYFLEGLDLNQATFFRVDECLVDNALSFMVAHQLISDTQYQNLTAYKFHSNACTDVPAKKPLLDFFKKYLYNDHLNKYITEGKHYQNLQEYFEQDLEMYNSVVYYQK